MLVLVGLLEATVKPRFTWRLLRLFSNQPINKRKFREWLDQIGFYQRPLERLKNLKPVDLGDYLALDFLDEQFREKIDCEIEGFVDWLIRYKNFGYQYWFYKNGGCLELCGIESIEANVTGMGAFLGIEKLADFVVFFEYGENGKLVLKDAGRTCRFDNSVFDEYLHSLERFWCGCLDDII